MEFQVVNVRIIKNSWKIAHLGDFPPEKPLHSQLSNKNNTKPLSLSAHVVSLAVIFLSEQLFSMWFSRSLFENCFTNTFCVYALRHFALILFHTLFFCSEFPQQTRMHYFRLAELLVLINKIKRSSINENILYSECGNCKLNVRIYQFHLGAGRKWSFFFV